MQTNFEVGDEVEFNNSYEEPVRGIVQQVCKGSQLAVLFDDRPYPVYVNKSNPDLKIVKLAKQKEISVSNIRNVPHAEIQVKWLGDDSLIVQYETQASTSKWVSIENGTVDWLSTYNFRLIKKAPAVKKYHVAYEDSGIWKATARLYATVSEFYSENYPNFADSKAEIIQASMVQYDESVEVVFVSPATE